MNAIILAAGQGTRLKPLTNDKPKCLVPLFGKSILEWQLDLLNSFKIKNISTNKYLSESAVKEIFPPDIITGDYIIITRLRPKMSDNLQGEHLKFTASFDVGNAKQDGMYNVVSTAAYGATTDMVKANDVWNEKKQELAKSGLSEEEMENQANEQVQKVLASLQIK